MPRGKRTRIATGIYRDAFGYSIITNVHGVQKEERFAASSDPLKLQAIRANWIVERTKGAPVPEAQSFARAVKDYLRTIPAGTRRYVNAEHDLGAWLPAFGKLDPSTITAQAIREQIAAWRSDDYAASTINHRRQELKNLFTFLNGKTGANPIRDVPKLTERADDARGQDPAVVEAILAQLRDSATLIRLRVWWETALPPSQQMRLRKTGFKPHRKEIYAQPRRKGAGVPGKTIPLTSAAVQALAAFFEAGLEGKSCSTSSIYKTFRRAVRKAKDAWEGDWPAPENLSPKDLRHSRLTEAYKRSRDLNAVAELGMHADLSTTQRYVRAVATQTARAAVDLMEHGTVPCPPGQTLRNAQDRRARRGTPTPRKSR